MSPRIVAYSDVESAYDDPEQIARLAETVRSLADERTLVVDAGDSTALGALAFATDRGRGQARPFVDRVAPDIHVPGNHDFDPGREWLTDFARQTDGVWLAANATRDGSAADGDSTHDTPPDSSGPSDPPAPFEAAATFDLAGETVGVIGVAHPETDELTTTGGVTFGDPVPAVRRVADRLTADHLVVASHGGRHDRRIARETAADCVIGAHSHDRTVERVGSTPLARTAAGGHRVVVADLAAGTAELRETTDATDETLAADYRARHERAGLDDRIGTTDDRSPEWVARRVARAYRRQARADCAVVLEASVRRGLSGAITRADALGVVPFGSTLQTVRIAGDDLRDALALAADGPLDDTHDRAIWAGAEPETETVGGDAPEPTATYEVAMMSYTAHADLLPGVTADRVVRDDGPQHEAWLTDLDDHGIDDRPE